MNHRSNRCKYHNIKSVDSFFFNVQHWRFSAICWLVSVTDLFRISAILYKKCTNSWHSTNHCHLKKRQHTNWQLKTFHSSYFLILLSSSNWSKVCTPNKGKRKHFLGKGYWEKFFLTQNHGHMQSLGSCGALLFFFFPSPPPSLCKKGHFLTLANTPYSLHF